MQKLRFHYPSEHQIDGVSYDLEMQIVLNDTLTRAKWCKSNQGAFSLFFNVGETQSEFWNWVGQTEKTIDLNNVFTKTSSLSSLMYSYVGTDTQPPCEESYCWYFNLPV